MHLNNVTCVWDPPDTRDIVLYVCLSMYPWMCHALEQCHVSGILRILVTLWYICLKINMYPWMCILGSSEYLSMTLLLTSYRIFRIIISYIFAQEVSYTIL